MTRQTSRRILILVILYVIALLSSVYLTFAYYKKDEHASIIITTGDARIIFHITFDELVVDSSSPYYDASTKQIIINASDPTSENAISKLKINVSIDTDYASRIRMKLMESYVKSRYYIQAEETLYEAMAVTENRVGYHPFSYLSYGDSYDMIYADDGYQYLPSILNENELIELPVVDGGLTTYARSNTQFVESITLYLSLSVEVVQANRYQEIWGISPSLFME